MNLIKRFCLFAHAYNYCASPLVLQVGKHIDLDRVLQQVNDGALKGFLLFPGPGRYGLDPDLCLVPCPHSLISLFDAGH